MRISDWSSDVCSSDLPVKKRPVRRVSQFSLRWFSGTCGLRKVAHSAGVSVSANSAENPIEGCVRQVMQIGGHGAGHAALRCSVFFCSRSSSILRRSEERRVGTECDSQCRSRWAAYHYTIKITTYHKYVAYTQ